MEEYQSIEVLKLKLLQSRAIQAMADIEAGSTIDGETFFKELESGQHD